ncbi:DUF6286 domain-containing protein [Actinomadura macrotermitis]|nr:DUF6286 domain-containing protein [Actinomadura macrotermitis]
MSDSPASEAIGEAGARRARRPAGAEAPPEHAAAGLGVTVLVVVVTGLAALEVLTTMTGLPGEPLPSGRVLAALRRTHWGDPAVLAAGAVLAVAGLGLLAAVLPGRSRVIPLGGRDGGVAGGIGRAALLRALDDAVREVPGVHRSRVRLRGLRRERVSVHAGTRHRNTPNLPEVIRLAVVARLERLGLAHRFAVEVELWRRGE